MNKILRSIGHVLRHLVEPGVTFQQLYDYIEDNKLGLMLSFSAPSAIAGPLGNTMDRGVGYTPYGEHFMMQCGMEVVLGNSDVYRTGMGGVPGNNTWQIFKWGYGPTLDGMFTQSNYGITTKMGWRCPSRQCTSPSGDLRERGGHRRIVASCAAAHLGTIPSSVVIANVLWEAGSAHLKRADYISEPGHAGPRAQKMQQDTGMGAEPVRGAVRHPGAGRRRLETRFRRSARQGRIVEEDASDTNRSSTAPS